MGQAEVFDFLKTNKESWFTAKQITDETGFSAGSVSVALKGLRKSDMVEFKIIKTVGYKGAKRGTYCYRYKGETQTKLMGYFAKS
jgi:DNA-binding transcriptional regulator GbsR (MarR family)